MNGASLTVAGKLAPHLTAENCERLLLNLPLGHPPAVTQDEVALPWSTDPEEGVCEAVASYEAVGTPGALPYAWLRRGWVGL